MEKSINNQIYLLRHIACDGTTTEYFSVGKDNLCSSFYYNLRNCENESMYAVFKASSCFHGHLVAGNNIIYGQVKNIKNNPLWETDPIMRIEQLIGRAIDLMG